MSNIAFIGLGKLGLPCAELMSQHHSVKGYDRRVVNSTSLIIVDSIESAISGAEFVFVAVQTPHATGYDGSSPQFGKPPKDFDYSFLVEALREISTSIESDQTVVVISTVLPGTVQTILAPLLPNNSLIYNPYFIAMGTVKEDFCDPEFVLLGGPNDSAGSAAIEKLSSFYLELIGERLIVKCNWEEAEAIKIFYNTFITMKITFVNMIQDVAVKMKSIDVDVVTNALGSANRRLTSSNYLNAGMGDGGPCHPRDNIALRYLTERLELNYDWFSPLLGARDAQAENLARFCADFDLPVVIVGRSYKPNIAITDGSYSALVAHFLRMMGSFGGYIDTLTGDSTMVDTPTTYLLAHGSWHDHEPFPGSIVVDPWRRQKAIEGSRIVYYGATSP